MNEPLIIRPIDATRAEVKNTVHSLIYDSFASSQAFSSQRAYSCLLANSSGWGIFRRQQLRGTIFCEYTAPRVIYISLLAVRPTYFRQGLGSTLFFFLLKRFPTCQFYGDVAQYNIAAMHLYTRQFNCQVLSTWGNAASGQMTTLWHPPRVIAYQ
ncbi:GNAT family N-acetyltransferase [Zooshikella harenae]|uniref:GNAT family N-acetyltransferase n=1 Tax=Zooshikella harenae TaxID=2827238 RepID=A0ABS5ZCU6_9GAMM|nr:GNAT family N-acetyltransferase [Zooshikella harenae]MBU2711136.1 GNAT family N-acetyltransferase [Zooshikella harenae]